MYEENRSYDAIRNVCGGGDVEGKDVYTVNTSARIICLFVASLVILSLILVVLHFFAANYDVELDTPVIVSYEKENGSITFSWSAVMYATSYRIYRKPAAGQWSLIAVCSSNQMTFTESISETEVAYAVRACNVAGKNITLSEMSAPVEMAGDVDG